LHSNLKAFSEPPGWQKDICPQKVHVTYQNLPIAMSRGQQYTNNQGVFADLNLFEFPIICTPDSFLSSRPSHLLEMQIVMSLRSRRSTRMQSLLRIPS
jgi:hypothetical protein